MFVGKIGSQVKIRKGTFGFNHANDRGGVITIDGSTLYINLARICEKHTARLGGVISACKSMVRIINPKVPATPDPIHPFCALYDCSSPLFST